jgi:hypothetical protein
MKYLILFVMNFLIILFQFYFHNFFKIFHNFQKFLAEQNQILTIVQTYYFIMEYQSELLYVL